ARHVAGVADGLEEGGLVPLPRKWFKAVPAGVRRLIEQDVEVGVKRPNVLNVLRAPPSGRFGTILTSMAWVPWDRAGRHADRGRHQRGDRAVAATATRSVWPHPGG